MHRTPHPEPPHHDHGDVTSPTASASVEVHDVRARVEAVTHRADTLLVSALPVRYAGRGVEGTVLDRATAMTRLDTLDVLLTRIELHDSVLGWPDSCRRAITEWRRLSLQDGRNWTPSTVVEYEQLR